MENEPNPFAAEFEAIIARRQLSILFQPIADLRRRQIHGFEALTRGPSDSSLHSPLPLFDAARRVGRLFELELLCRDIAAQRFRDQDLPGKLFLNATPVSLLQPDHRPGRTLEMLARAGLPPERVVIELTEQHPLEDYEVMRQATEHYRSMGFEIAIDDLGAGYSGLRMWAELRPDYVKIDRHFIQGIHEDSVKREFVRSILDIAEGLSCQVIAEGIETEAEYLTVAQMGISLGQGYYFARPHHIPQQSLPLPLFRNDPPRRCCARPIRVAETVGSLATPVPELHVEQPLGAARGLFDAHPELDTLPVLDAARRPLGLLHRWQLGALFGGPNTGTLSASPASVTAWGADPVGGRAVQAHAPEAPSALPVAATVAAVMEQEPLSVEHGVSLEEVSRDLTEMGLRRIRGEFVVTDESGRFVGLGQAGKVLQRITHMQRRALRYANPVTQLPGNVPTYEVLERHLAEGESFVAVYCDLDGFKPYNDAYGYARGDAVLRGLASLLCRHTDGPGDFVGHLREDDFLLVLSGEDWKARCEAICAGFARFIPTQYQPADRERGGIWVGDRNGGESFHTLLSLSMGVVRPDTGRCHSHHDVAELARGAIAQAKKQLGNSLFVDRRMAP